MNQDLVSFVLRFIREASEEQQARWRGVIKHVQSNSESSFNQFSEALHFMQEHVNEVIQIGFGEREKYARQSNLYNPVMETAKLWGEFMTPYTKMMTETMEEAVQASGHPQVAEKMKEAMTSTMNFWGLPAISEETRMAQVIENLNMQVTEMAAKIADLEAKLNSSVEMHESEEE